MVHQAPAKDLLEIKHLKNTDFRRKPLIVADFRRKPQEPAENRRSKNFDFVRPPPSPRILTNWNSPCPGPEIPRTKCAQNADKISGFPRVRGEGGYMCEIGTMW